MAGDDPTLFDDVTLGVARDWLRDRVDKGEKCPCCGQFAKVYRRKINSGMARALIAFYRKYRRVFGDCRTLDAALRSGEFAKLAYWRLVEEMPERREDGGRVGWWRITEWGERFVLDAARLPKYVRIYDGRVLGFDDSQQAGIRDALGTKFRYDDLMAGI